MFRFFHSRSHAPRTFMLFLSMIFLIHVVDAIMGYLVPVIMERTLESVALMGLVMSFSSIVGISSDILMTRFFPNQRLHFFARMTIVGVCFFPLILLFPHRVELFLIAMGIWGLYYETLTFTKYHGIHLYIHPHHHGWAWGVIESLHNIALVMGPFLASLLFSINESFALLFALVVSILAIAVYGILQMGSRTQSVLGEQEEQVNVSFVQQLKIWRTYEGVLWPLLGLMVLLYLVDSAFFSIGPIFSEQLKLISPLGGMFVSMYSVPGLVMGLVIGMLARPFGKKRLAFTAGIFSGCGLMVMSTMQTIPTIILTTFIASLGLGIMFPTLAAIFEDYVARSEHKGNFIISLMSMSAGVAYVIGPVINGILTERFSPQFVFFLWGLILAWYSFALFFLVKRKVRLPQQAVEGILGE